MTDAPGAKGAGAGAGGDHRAEHRPAAQAGERESRRAEERRHMAAMSSVRDTTPALGSHASPAPWRRAIEGARVAWHRPAWADARWSYLFGPDTDYARPGEADGVAAAARRMRAEGLPPPELIHGPFLQPPVWTWEVPLYFWFGGVAAGSSFVAAGCDAVGDHGRRGSRGSSRWARLRRARRC